MKSTIRRSKAAFGLIIISMMLFLIQRVSTGINEPPSECTDPAICCHPFLLQGQPTDQTACEGSTVVFHFGMVCEAGFHFVWRKNGVVLTNGPTGYGSSYGVDAQNLWSTDLYIYNVQPADAVSASSGFDCLFTGPCCEGVLRSSRVGLTVKAIPAAPTASNNGAICAGGTLNLYASPVTGATYSWTGPNGFTSSVQNPSITNATTAASGIYTVRVTVASCTSAAATTTANVNGIPTASNNGPICARGILNLTASTVAGATYSWTGPNGFTSTAQNPSIANATTAASGTYTVTVTVPSCGSATATTTATVNNAPVVTANPTNLTVFAGDWAIFTAAASGSPDPTVQWQVSTNGGAMFSDWVGKTNTTLSFITAIGDNGKHYRTVFNNTCGSATSTAATLIVTQPCPRLVVGWGDDGIRQTDVPSDLTDAVAIGAGDWHSLAVKANGTAVSWGDNTYGQTNVPPGLTNVVAVAGGYGHSLALKGDGTVVAWGWNIHGQTNVPPGLANLVAIACGDYHNLALKSDGTVVAWGDDSYGQTDIPSGLTNVVGIAGGGDYSLALKSDGTVVAWGDDSYGQTDVPSGLTNVVGIAGGRYHSLALEKDGTVVAWGDDSYGQTDIPSGLTNVVGIAGGGDYSLALKSDGTVVAWGDDSYGQTDVPSGLTNVVAITCGYGHSLALTSSCFIGPPFALTAITVSSSQINLEWADNSSNEDGFKIERAPDSSGVPGAWTQIATVGMNVTTYSDVGLASSTKYWYRVRAYNASGNSEYSNQAEAVTPCAQPSISPPPPASQTVCQGQSVSFSVSATGDAPLSYQWRKNDSNIPPASNPTATNSTLTLDNVTMSDNGSYYDVVVSNSCGSVTSSPPATLTVLLQPTIISQPLSQYVVDGDTVTFSIDTGVDTNLTYQWTLNDVLIPGATNSSYTINNVQDSDDASHYAVIISGGTNSVTSATATLTTCVGTDTPYIIPIISSRQDYTFRSGVTYYIGSAIQLFGDTTIEGGAVLKFDWSTNSTLAVMGTLTCKTEQYYPAILTSVDDDAAGEWLWCSQDYPQTAENGVPYLDLSAMTTGSVSNLRVCYADKGIATPSGRLDVWDCQFGACNAATVASQGATDSLHNVLFSDCGTAVGAVTNFAEIDAEQVTADVSTFWNAPTAPSRINLTNSIILGTFASGSAVSSQNVALDPSGTIFQTVDYGNYYLATNSPYRGAGTANISPQLLAELRNKTTCPPVSLAAYMQISGDMTLFPQAPRYTNGPPDLGYYYAALDYTVANFTLVGGHITVAPGTAIAVRNEYECLPAYDYFTVLGFDIREGSAFISHGTPTKPNIFTAEKLVQEVPETDFSVFELSDAGWWFGTVTFAPDFELNDNNSPAPTLDFRFSKFYLPPDDYHIWSGMDEIDSLPAGPASSMYLTLQDCSVHGGEINLGHPDDPNQVYAPGAVSWVNNSFENVNINLDPTYNEYGYGVNCDISLQAYNNLFRGGSWFHLEPIPASAGNWVFKDNLFDRVDFCQDVNQPLDYDYNGYWPLSSSELKTDSGFYFWYYWCVPNTSQLSPTTAGGGGHEQVLTIAPPYQTGPFGNYYLPNTTLLYGAGSRSPADAGLYQYTTRINQVKDGDESSGHKVNIGLHYVAAVNGQPKDSDGDGIPDYVEDANGNGVVDANETDWLNPMTDGSTPDAYSTVYDDIDLSGDGLVGRIKKALGMSPFDTSNPLIATQIVAGQEPGIAAFEVPVSYSLLTNIGSLYLLVDSEQGGEFQVCESAPDGNCLLRWNTTFDSPGLHYVQVQFNLNGQITPDSTVLTGVGQLGCFYSTNICQFDPFYASFDNGGAILYATTPACPQASYSIELQTTSGQHIRTITNSTTSGVISENWDLTDDNGNIVTNDTIKAVFNVTLLDPASGSLDLMLHRLLYGGDGNFSIAYAWNFDSVARPYDGALWCAIQHGVVDPLISPPESGGSGSLNPYGYDPRFNDYSWSGGHGNPGYLVNQDDADKRVYINLEDVNTMNFHFSGHGTPDELTDGRDQVYIYRDVVAAALNNKFNWWGDAIWLQHPYRFVFLEACRTADNPGWAHAFGIPKRIRSDQLAKNAPQAFLGWVGLGPGPGDSENDCNEMAKTYAVFYGAWQNGFNLQTCLDMASKKDPYGDGSVVLNFPLGADWLRDSPKYRNSHLRVYGYAGIVRTGFEPGYDSSPYYR